MTANTDTRFLNDEQPSKVDIRKDLYRPIPFIAPGTVDPASLDEAQATKEANAVLATLNAALDAKDPTKLETCFFSGQAFWRDMLALSYHLRTFTNPSVIAAALLETTALRALTGEVKLIGSAKFVPATPVLQFIDCYVTFRTLNPGATCHGRMLLLPVSQGLSNGQTGLGWKIWILTTWIENLDIQPEDTSLLKIPRRRIDGVNTIETDVFIIGGGNSAASLSARLKALGVQSIVAERNASVGDNWALRYDCLRFHVCTSSCEMPYLRYKPELQTPHLLSRTELAEHLKEYVSTFDLNFITSSQILSTVYDTKSKRWTVRLQTPEGARTVVSKNLVQATGIGSVRPRIPPIKDAGLYKGVTLHSVQYKNAKLLAEEGAKSVVIIGSANTAFDLIEDCYKAGLQTTMVVRSPTYIFPFEYTAIPQGFGMYDLMPIETVDKAFMTVPAAVDGQLTHALFAHLASMEPDRYKALAARGFPVIDSRHPDADLLHHLLERAGGHFVDVGDGVQLLSEGKVGIKALVEPVSYTESGLRFSDGSTLDADAVVWCTGFADQDARSTATDVLGGGQNESPQSGKDDVNLGPHEIAARLDSTWCLDAEGEIRGMWKRHQRMENYWVMGGHMQHQRWWSRILAQQIKASLEGILPPAYYETPKPAVMAPQA